MATTETTNWFTLPAVHVLGVNSFYRQFQDDCNACERFTLWERCDLKVHQGGTKLNNKKVSMEEQRKPTLIYQRPGKI